MSVLSEPAPPPGAGSPRWTTTWLDVPGGRKRIAIPRNTVHETWAWLWKDALGRVAPFYGAAALYAWNASRGGGGLAALGLQRAGWRREVALGLACGPAMAAVAAAYRARVIPGYRLPTLADQAFQTAYYFLLNAAAEELFWRAAAQTLAIRALGLAPLPGSVARLGGWAFISAAFGAYHRLGGWSWRAIAGATAAGAFFGALYEWRRPRAILLPAVLHAFATAGFLSWGDVVLHQLALRRLRHP